MSTFIKLNVESNKSGLSQLSPASYTIFGEVEKNSLVHWLFGGGEFSLIDKKSEQAATLVEKNYPAQYNNFGMLWSNNGDIGTGAFGDRHGIKTDIIPTDNFTVIYVLKGKGSSGYKMLVDTTNESLSVGVGIGLSYDSGTGFYQTQSGDDTLLAADVYTFVAVTYNITTGRANFFTAINDATSFISNGGKTHTYNANVMSELTLGSRYAMTNPYYAVRGFVEATILESIVLNGELSETELQELYIRSKQRMARRGVTI